LIGLFGVVEVEHFEDVGIGSAEYLLVGFHLQSFFNAGLCLLQLLNVAIFSIGDGLCLAEVEL
jgi:hypothetical protein